MENGKPIGPRLSCRFPSPNPVNQKQHDRRYCNDDKRDAVHTAHKGDQLVPVTPKQKSYVADCQCPANGARETKKQKGQERHTQNARHNSRKDAHARNESCCKNRPLSVLVKLLLGIIVPLQKPRETSQETINDGSATVPAYPIAKARAGGGPGNGGKDRRQNVDRALVGEKAGKQEDRLTGDGDTDVFQHHAKEDYPVPVACEGVR